MLSLDRYARDEPETLAAEVLTEDEREVIGIVVRGERMLPLCEIALRVRCNRASDRQDFAPFTLRAGSSGT